MRDRTTSGQSRVRTAIEAAWRRRSLVLMVEELSVGLAIALAGAVLMLLFGTGILSWPWLLLLALSGAAVTFSRVRRRMLGRYRVAQIVDRRLNLSDALSTAWFLLEGAGRSDAAVAQLQISRAENLAQRVEPRSAFPFVWKRAWAVTGALAAVALGLFTLRYLVASKLTFEQSLIPARFLPTAEVFERAKELIARDRASNRSMRGLTANVRTEKQPARDKDPDQQKSPDQKFNKPANGSARQSDGGAQMPGNEPNNRQDGPGQPQVGDKSESQKGGSEHDPSRRNASSPEKQDRDGSEQHSSSLMSKMKDALSGFMEKMRPQDAARKPGETARSSQEAKPGDQAAESSRRDGDQARQSPRDSQENQGEGRQGSAQGQAQAQATEKAPASQSQVSNQSADSKGSDAHSGIGRQDGEKALKEAEQLRAMGKLEEIIGKRSASLTGDMTIETRSGRQQLQTQYSGRVGQHADSGGEIDRDEVPLALQKYVRDYMEQVRKQPDKLQ